MKTLMLVLSALLLSSCATVFTPTRCETALGAARDLQQLVVLLGTLGFEVEKAERVAAALQTGEVTIATICALSRPPVVPAPEAAS